MKDLMKLVAICETELDSIGIKHGKVRNWSVNTRAKCRLGQCIKIAPALFDINISAMLLNDDIEDQITLNTIMHELLHTLPGCLTHEGKWRSYADYVNEKLPQYNITRVANVSETGIAVDRKPPVYRYVLRCSKCGQEIRRQKKSKVIMYYKNYRCGKCGSNLKKIL